MCTCTTKGCPTAVHARTLVLRMWPSCLIVSRSSNTDMSCNTHIIVPGGNQKSQLGKNMHWTGQQHPQPTLVKHKHCTLWRQMCLRRREGELVWSRVHSWCDRVAKVADHWELHSLLLPSGWRCPRSRWAVTCTSLSVFLEQLCPVEWKSIMLTHRVVVVSYSSSNLSFKSEFHQFTHTAGCPVLPSSVQGIPSFYVFTKIHTVP